MPINVKDPDVIKLATRLAALTGESKTEAIRRALEERISRVSLASAQSTRRAELVRVLGCKSNSMIRPGRRKTSLTAEEVQELLAYGP